MKSIFEELGGTFVRQGDYRFPALVLPESDHRKIDVFGQRYGRCRCFRGCYKSDLNH